LNACFIYISHSHHRLSFSLSPVADLGAVAFLPVGAAALLSSMVLLQVAASTIDFGQGNTPFTAQEWIWAMKGEYFGDMMSHYLRNGGM
jgi:hypothetical protein